MKKVLDCRLMLTADEEFEIIPFRLYLNFNETFYKQMSDQFLVIFALKS